MVMLVNASVGAGRYMLEKYMHPDRLVELGAGVGSGAKWFPRDVGSKEHRLEPP